MTLHNYQKLCKFATCKLNNIQYEEIYNTIECPLFDMSGQNKSFLIEEEIKKQDSFVVYAELSVDNSGRIEFNFGQEEEGGYYFGDITIKLVDENDKCIFLGKAPYTNKVTMKIVNDLVKAGWTVLGDGINSTDFRALFSKVVRSEKEIIEGLRFQKIKK